MGATFVQHGRSIDYVPDADVASGDVIVLSDLVAIATSPIAAGKLGALAVTGVFDFPKATGAGSAITAGARLYWDAAEGVAKADAEAGGNKLLGKSIKAAGDDDATVRAVLSPGDAVTVTAEQGDAVADAAAVTAEDAPAGGVGAAAGGWDTAEHRDAAIATINALVDDVTALRTTVNSLLASLRAAGLLAE